MEIKTEVKPTEAEVEVKVSDGIYAKYIKRAMDFFLSFCAIVLLLPILVILTVIGAIEMKGNPFFTQQRPGRIDKKMGTERIFKLIKFRTMTNEKDEGGNLLPDDKRLTKYGKLLRLTSLDELPELINILKGDMAIVGPRPLVPQYLPYYNDRERHRHDVRPGLTGLAQINGRNCINWPQRFLYDIRYVENIKFTSDVSIIFRTVLKVLKRSDITVRASGTIVDFDKYRILENEETQNGKISVKQ